MLNLFVVLLGKGLSPDGDSSASFPRNSRASALRNVMIEKTGGIFNGTHFRKNNPAEKGTVPQTKTRPKSDRFGLFSLLTQGIDIYFSAGRLGMV
jgi:hypothetical protein